MKKLLLLLIAVASFFGAASRAQDKQDIAGNWQGTLAGANLRLIVQIAKAGNGWSAALYSIDQGGGAIPASSITLEGSSLKFSSSQIGGSYTGTLSPDGQSITGTWTQGGGPRPLNLQRATKETAWEIPNPAKGHTQIALDPKIADSYLGRYQLGPAIFNVARHGDHIDLVPPAGNPLELFAESPKEFFAKVAPIQVSFHTDDQGNATEFVLHQQGRDNTAKRIIQPTADALKSRIAEIDALVAAAYAKQPIGSVTVGIVSGKDLIWTKSYGDADMEKKLPADKDTIYRIGSITKMFTAVMLEQFVDAGKVHLSDPAEKYFPEIKTVQGRYADAPPVTLIELATHTSGLGREPDNTGKYVQGPIADWEKTLIAALPQTHYILEPGTRFAYSNIGYATLGATLARAAGQPYTEYVPQHIFTPLGMTHTALDLTALSPDMLPHLSTGYDVNGSKISPDGPRRELKGRGYKVPNGAIFTTVGDLARFASFLMGQGPDTVLKASSLDRYQNQIVPADFLLTNGYGIGFMTMRRDNYVAFGHGGDVTGYQAALYMNRNAGIGVILLSNALGNGALSTDDLTLRSLDLLSK
jgi:CubicO group peptidase (beta-lactamase class C family)